MGLRRNNIQIQLEFSTPISGCKRASEIIFIYNEWFKFKATNSSENIVLDDDFFMRYDNKFSKTDWGSKLLNIQAGDKTISLDIENITINLYDWLSSLKCKYY